MNNTEDTTMVYMKLNDALEIEGIYTSDMNIPDGCVAVTEDQHQEFMQGSYTHYDEGTNTFLSVDSRTPAEIAEAASNRWKQVRDSAVRAITVVHDANTYQGDEKSQDRMSRAINALPDETTTIGWVSAGNTVVQLNRADLQVILRLSGAEQSRLWVEGRP